MGFREWPGWLKGALIGFVIVLVVSISFGNLSFLSTSGNKVLNIIIDILVFVFFGSFSGLIYDKVISLDKRGWFKGGLFFGLISLLASLIYSITQIIPNINYLDASAFLFFVLSPGVLAGMFSFMGASEITLFESIKALFIGAIVSFVLYFIIGAIIGSIIGAMKKSKSNSGEIVK